MGDEVEQIKDRIDIAQLIAEYVPLKKAGRHFKASCPFHQEKTPSFIVSPEKGFWHCFGCGKGGDVFSFIQEKEGLDFPSALKMLAERASVELKNTREAKDNTGRSRRQRLYELLEMAARFYHEVLANQPAGEKAKEYLAARGVKSETSRLFQLGYAPKQWDTLQQFLKARGYREDEMIETGMVGRSKGAKLYDRFRGRITFPISDVQGRVVAFGGRIVPWHETGEEGKYVNSPETELYEKRKVVYNLDKAKLHLKEGVPGIVVEGYMDVVMLVQAGVNNVVSSSGTAFTDEAIELLGRYTKELHFAFDPDVAGLTAAVAATEAALTGGMRVATIELPAGQDPADLAAKSEVELKKRLINTKSLVVILLDKLEESEEGRDREKNLSMLIPVVARVSNPVYQGELVSEIATILHVPEDQIVRQVELAAEELARSGQYIEEKDVEEEEDRANILRPEHYLLGLVIADKEVRKRLFNKIRKKLILAEDAQTLYNDLQGLAESNSAFARWTADDLLRHLPEERLSLAEGLRQLAEERAEQSQSAVIYEGNTLLQRMMRRSLELQLADLQGRLAQGDNKERAQLLERFKSVAHKLSRIEVSS